MTTPTVEVRGVSKWFGPLVALSDVSFTLQPGITALLGPNGAGKSTLLRIMCGLTAPSQGSVRILGLEPRRDLDLNRRIGLVPQQEAMFETMRPHDFVAVAAALHGIPSPEQAAAAALQAVELDPSDQRPIKTYSKGMRQRVKVAQAIVHSPEIVFLDEPLEGLDPRQRARMIDLFRTLAGEGRTVVVSSHVLDEVERFGSNVLVIGQGRVAAEGDFHAIRELMDDRPHRIRLVTNAPRRLAAALIGTPAVVGAWVDGDDGLLVDTLDVALFRSSVAKAAVDVDARLYELLPLDDDLESVFRYLVGRR